MEKEYEYSFKSKSINEFIDYCINNNYKLTKEFKQTRTLYKNGGKVMARITKNVYKNKTQEELLNFKDDKLENSILKESRETKNLIITDDNREFVKSLIEILDLNDIKELVRDRKVYKKENVIFEIDEYQKPKMNVVAIEGIKKEVDKVYKELKNIIDKNIINE